MNSTIEVNVDVSNPGQVFACCGIFELTHRMATGKDRALGWFEDIDKVHTKFLIDAYDQNEDLIRLNDILQKLKKCKITALEYNDKEGPVLIGEPFNMIIDWRKPFPQNGSVKTWAGQQKISSILNIIQKSIPKIVQENNLFEYSYTTDKKFTKFDPSNMGTSIDAGFSYNTIKGKLGMKFSSFIYTELLSLIGLQGFVPINIDRKRRLYNIWKEPIRLELARSVISKNICCINIKSYIFEMYIQGSEKNSQLKSFTYANHKNWKKEE